MEGLFLPGQYSLGLVSPPQAPLPFVYHLKSLELLPSPAAMHFPVGTAHNHSNLCSVRQRE